MVSGRSGRSAIFGAYDVRGRYPKEFPPSVCRRLADALASAAGRAFVSGRDTRVASRLLEARVAGRLRTRGRSVVELGIQPTPLIGFASAHLDAVGLAFTPSHNALGYAGLKGFATDGRTFSDEWNKVRRDFDRSPPARRGFARARAEVRRARRAVADEVVEAYLAHVTRGLHSRQSVVVDGRGGPTTHLAPRALARIGATVGELHPSYSSRFHGASPEPDRDNVADLGRRVRLDGADLGVAFDGDGDRVVFVDGRGRWVETEVIGTFLHRHLSPRRRPMVVSIDASSRCENVGPVVRSRVGSRFLSATMRRHGSTVGFETSAHYYLRDWGPNSDGILVACVVAHLLDRTRTTLADLSRNFGPIRRGRETVALRDRSEAAAYLRSLRRKLGPRLSATIDGFVFRAKEGTVLIRRSNTQPALRVTYEPSNRSTVLELRRRWRAEIRP